MRREKHVSNPVARLRHNQPNETAKHLLTEEEKESARTKIGSGEDHHDPIDSRKLHSKANDRPMTGHLPAPRAGTIFLALSASMVMKWTEV